MTAQKQWSNTTSVLLILGIISIPVVAGFGARYLENRNDERVAQPAPAVITQPEIIPSPEPTVAAQTDYSGEMLVGADFYAQTLYGATFDRSNLKRATFVEAELAGASFVGADLTRADFSSTELMDVSFRGADLTGATFDYANLRGADLTGATIANVSFQTTTGVSERMIAAALGIPMSEIAYEIHARRIQMDTIDTYAPGFERLCKGRGGIAGAAPYAPADRFRPMIVLGPESSEAENWSALAMKRRWHPMGMRYLQLVACARELKPEKIENCGLYQGGGYSNVVHRAHERTRIFVAEAKTGRILFERVYVGPEPEPCPDQVYAGTGFFTGGDIQFGEIESILAGYVGAAPGR